MTDQLRECDHEWRYTGSEDHSPGVADFIHVCDLCGATDILRMDFRGLGEGAVSDD